MVGTLIGAFIIAIIRNGMNLMSVAPSNQQIVLGAVLLLATRTTNPVVEITLTIIAAYGSFLLAEHRHMSGVLASLAAGLVLGNLGHKRAITPSGGDAVIATWDSIAFLANSVVFILIGIHVAAQGSRIFSATAAVALNIRLSALC